MDIDLNKQWPELTKYIYNLNPDGSQTKIADIYRMANANKQLLRAHMCMGDLVRVEEVIENNINDKFKISLNMLKKILPDVSVEEIISNKTKDGARVSKLITKRAEDVGPYFFQQLSIMEYTTKEELPKCPTASSFIETKDGLRTVNHDKLVSTVVQNFYSELAAVKNTVVGFSTDMFDFMNAGSSSAFTSCFSVDHFNSAGPLTIAMNKYTGVFYVKNNSAIIGRAWVLFESNFKQFAVMKPYGFLDRTVLCKLENWLCAVLNNTEDWTYGNVNDDNVCFINVPNGWYIDPIRRIYSCKDTYEKNIVIHDAVNSPCIFCGKVHPGSTLWCDDCREKYLTKCTRCGHEMYVEEKKTFNFCNDCLSKVVKCPKCGTETEKGQPCPKCSWDHTCAVCGKKSEFPLQWVSGVPVCSDCQKSLNKGVCDICGEHAATYPYDNMALCFTCFGVIEAVKHRGNFADAVYRANKNPNTSAILQYIREHVI